MTEIDDEAGKRLVGVYPGTFDPITLGHLDIIDRASKLVDHLIVAVATNAGKGPMFDVAERVDMVKRDIRKLQENDDISIEVVSFSNLLVDFAESVGAAVMVRGLRAVSDFEYEFQMVGMNAHLNPDIETVFLMAKDNFQFISSRFVKEIGALGGDITQFVSPHVKTCLEKKFAA